MDEKFSYAASIKGLLLTLVFEGILIWMTLQMAFTAQDIMVLCLAFMGMGSLLILSKEVIHEYKDPVKILAMFMITIFQFVFFFAFQYWFLLLVSPESFSGFALLPVDFFLQSMLIFLFNPTVIPQTEVARVLVLMNLFGAMVIIMFTLQNIWHFKERTIYQ